MDVTVTFKATPREFDLIRDAINLTLEVRRQEYGNVPIPQRTKHNEVTHQLLEIRDRLR